ncbi:hypothetical protein F8O07_03800 [Pseudoclavibacter sp. CFCC 13796]|uniref:nucleotidyltransferase family protein n=1 Tax=Pseudoclavibacter sp. CFCC 13796 TaxID=2615179 RepID=UPI0013014583|nr:nucleotidyltransferase family protein [Pseudoclavibacter sp. CFCC 13796]KAB1661090.1 hypothetical protein F8O07_03800 [Pseudoclavibacter sp. CFCC 13796]
MSENLPLAVAVQLAAGWCAEVARFERVRVLFIKGAAAVAQGLRPEGERGTDVDVLVDPVDFDRFVQALIARGWLARPQLDNEFHILQYHSVTLIHPQWPCDIDVHYYFPGFFAPEQQAFDALAQHAETVDCADGTLPIPSRNAHAVLLAVNALRGDGSPRAQAEMRRMIRYFSEDADRWQQALHIAHLLRAGTVLAPFARQAGLPMPGNDLSTSEARAWQMSCASGGGVSRVLYHAPSSSWRERVRLLRWAIWRSGQELRNAHPDLPAGALSTLRGNVERWGRGLAQARGLARLPRIGETRKRVATQAASASTAPEFGRDVEPAGLPHAVIVVDKGTIQVSAPRGQGPVSSTRPSQFALPRDPFQVVRVSALSVESADTIYVLPQNDGLVLTQPLVLSGAAKGIWHLLGVEPIGVSTLQELVAHSAGLQIEECADLVKTIIVEFVRASLVRCDSGAPAVDQ